MCILFGLCACQPLLYSATFNRDPNLWTVKCRIGSERETALIMMKKFASLQFSENVSCGFLVQDTFKLLVTYLDLFSCAYNLSIMCQIL